MFNIFPFSKAKSNLWSGGKTTELYIFPENTNYPNHDFKFRISTATIETKTSTFSKLSGYNRILSVLEGELEISHEQHPSKKLSDLELYSFTGEWNTTSKGLARDFNIIFDQSFSVNLQMIGSDTETEISKTKDFLFLFVLNDKTRINSQLMGKYDLIEIGEEKIILDAGSTCFRIEIYI